MNRSFYGLYRIRHGMESARVRRSAPAGCKRRAPFGRDHADRRGAPCARRQRSGQLFNVRAPALLQAAQPPRAGADRHHQGDAGGRAGLSRGLRGVCHLLRRTSHPAHLGLRRHPDAEAEHDRVGTGHLTLRRLLQFTDCVQRADRRRQGAAFACLRDGILRHRT